MATIQINFDKDWGEVGHQWTGKEVQDFIKNSFKTIIDAVNPVISFYEQLSTNDGKTWGIRNGKPELIAESGEAVLVCDEETAVSVALNSLSAGQLLLAPDSDKVMVAEVKKLLGEDLFNELAAQSVSVQTMELAPQLTDEQKLEEAKVEYYRIKEDTAQLKAMQEEAEASMEAERGLDVEQNKAE